MNTGIRYLILVLLLGTNLHPRTTRKKSSVAPIIRSQAPQPTIEQQTYPAQTAQTMAPEKTAESANQEAIQPEEISEQENQPAPESPLSSETNGIIGAFNRKLNGSTLFLKDALDESFYYLIITSRHPKAFNSQQVNFQRNNIIYLINKHLREIVSAFTDRNSFLNGALLDFFMRMQDDPIIQAKQASFMLNFATLGDQLQKFTIKRIDQELPKEIINQIKLIKERATYLKASAIGHENFTAITDSLMMSLDDYYIYPLEYLLKKLETPEIKGILPLPETLKTKIARKIKKITNPILSFATLKVHQEIDQLYGLYLHDAYVIARSFILSPLLKQSKQESTDKPESWSQWLWGKFATTSDDKAFGYVQNLVVSFTNEVERRFIYNFIMSARYVPFIILYYWLLSKNDNQEINILMSSVDKLYSRKLIALDWASHFITTYITSFFKKIEQTEKPSQEHLKMITQGLQNLQIEIYRHRRLIISELTNNDSITNQYLILLDSNSRRLEERECQEAFSQTPDGKKLTDALESAPKEELHNANMTYMKKYNDYKSSHRFFPLSQTIVEQASQVIFEDENIEKATLLDSLTKLSAYNKENITKTLIETMELCKTIVISIDEAIEELEKVESKNKNNVQYNKLKEQAIGLQKAAAINKLLTAAPSDEDRAIMRSRLEKHKKRIREELQSFGQRTSYQMLRSVLQIGIDQEFSIKLKAHLRDLEADIANLIKDANHVIVPVNSNGDPYYNTSYFISQGIQNTEGEKITIPYPLVSPAVAYTIQELITKNYINPLKLLVKKTSKESPVWKMLPQKTLLKTFIAPQFMQFKIAGKIASSMMQYIIWELPLSTSIRILIAPYQALTDPKIVSDMTRTNMSQLVISSLSAATTRLIGPWIPQAIKGAALSHAMGSSENLSASTIIGRTAAELLQKGASFSESKIGSETVWQAMQRDIKDRMYRAMRPISRIAREI